MSLVMGVHNYISVTFVHAIATISLFLSITFANDIVYYAKRLLLVAIHHHFNAIAKRQNIYEHANRLQMPDEK